MIAAVALIVGEHEEHRFLSIALAILVAITQTGWRPFLASLRAARCARCRLGAVAIGGSLAWFLFLPSSTSSIIPTIPTTPLSAFLRATFGVFQYGDGLIGSFGWLDTPAPTFMAIRSRRRAWACCSSMRHRRTTRSLESPCLRRPDRHRPAPPCRRRSRRSWVHLARPLPVAMYICAVVAAGISLDRAQMAATPAQDRDRLRSLTPTIAVVLIAAQWSDSSTC